MGIFGTGQAIRRTEDQRFLTGQGRFTDDIKLEGQAWLYLLRSPFAHGIIAELDVSDALDVEGVLCVLTAQDLEDAGVRDIVGADFPESSLTGSRPAVRQRPLARGRVRYVGEPVVGIIAESLATAKDAAELIHFDVDELPSVISVSGAIADGAVLLHDDVDSNRLGILEHGDRTASNAAFAQASHVVSADIVNCRIAPTAMEARACNASFDRSTGELAVYQGCQGVHSLRDRIRQSFDIEEDKIHVISPDVGGAFGLKFFLQCESVVAIAAAMRLGRPVKWTGDRSESFLADVHGRDQTAHAEMALDDSGRILGMRTAIQCNIGAYSGQFGPMIAWYGASMNTGCYDIAAAYVTVECAYSNTVPTDAYRGAGRPEAAFIIETLIEKAARVLDLSSAGIRHRNFIRSEQFPYTTPTGRVYDSGEYSRLLDRALDRADYAAFEQRRRESAESGRLRGIGIAYYVEICSAGGSEQAHVRFEDNGRVSLLVGTQASGQGHETSYAQMVASELGIDLHLVDVRQGDTRLIPTGGGTGGSRSMVMAGSSLLQSVAALLEDGKAVAAELLETAVEDIEFRDGSFRIAGTDRSTDIHSVAAASFDDRIRPDGIEPGLHNSEAFTISNGTFPNGCHVVELEIDPQTGQYDILRYTVEDDVGTVVNPLILEGQIVGGIAQGLGQACGEHAYYDPDTGQLITATFMDYTMPRADRIPDVDFAFHEVPSPANPLGIKGAGEAGTVGSAPAFMNAISDALAGKVEREKLASLHMPITALKVWELLNA